MKTDIIVSTSETVNGKHPKKTLGLVKGNTIRARWFGRDIAAAFKNLIGGEIKSYTKLIDDARNEALERMIQEAKNLGANAVVMVRFASSDVMQGASEILAYGTAVVVWESWHPLSAKADSVLNNDATPDSYKRALDHRGEWRPPHTEVRGFLLASKSKARLSQKL